MGFSAGELPVSAQSLPWGFGVILRREPGLDGFCAGASSGSAKGWIFFPIQTGKAVLPEL